MNKRTCTEQDGGREGPTKRRRTDAQIEADKVRLRTRRLNLTVEERVAAGAARRLRKLRPVGTLTAAQQARRQRDMERQSILCNKQADRDILAGVRADCNKYKTDLLKEVTRRGKERLRLELVTAVEKFNGRRIELSLVNRFNNARGGGYRMVQYELGRRDSTLMLTDDFEVMLELVRVNAERVYSLESCERTANVLITFTIIPKTWSDPDRRFIKDQLFYTSAKSNNITEDGWMIITNDLRAKVEARYGDVSLMRVAFKLFPLPAGGGRGVRKLRVDDATFIDFDVPNNNCFFACVHGETPGCLLEKITKNPCNAWRGELGIVELNSAVTITDAMRFIVLKGLDFNAQVSGSARVDGDPNATHSLYLDDGHWLRLSHKSTVCGVCFLRYEKVHSAKACNERVLYQIPAADRLARFASAPMRALTVALVLDDIAVEKLTYPIVRDRVLEFKDSLPMALWAWRDVNTLEFLPQNLTPELCETALVYQDFRRGVDKFLARFNEEDRARRFLTQLPGVTNGCPMLTLVAYLQWCDDRNAPRERSIGSIDGKTRSEARAENAEGKSESNVPADIRLLPCYHEVASYDIETQTRSGTDDTPYIEQKTIAVTLHWRQLIVTTTVKTTKKTKTNVTGTKTTETTTLGGKVSQQFFGDNALEQMVRRLATLPDHVTVLNAYNGANFDHYPLLQAFGRCYPKERPSLTITKGSIIKGYISFVSWDKGKPIKRSFKLWDVAKHCGAGSSLASNLKAMRCVTQKLIEEEGFYTKLGPWATMSPELQQRVRLYIIADGKGLQELTEILMETAFARTKCVLHRLISTSHLAWNVLSDQYLRHSIGLMDEVGAKFVRDATYGGRVNVNKKVFTSADKARYDRHVEEGTLTQELVDELKDYLVDADVVSLYVAAMMGKFPIGHAIKTEVFVPGKMGIYDCVVRCPKNLSVPILPRKEGGNLKWDLLDRAQRLTTIDIEDALACDYEIDIGYGYYWDQTAGVFREYMETFFAEKANTPKESPMYTLAKLMVLAPFGKTMQRSIHTKSKNIDCAAQLYEILADNQILSFEELGTYARVEYESIHALERDEDCTKPVHLGAFVLSYSRRIMTHKRKLINPDGTVRDMEYYSDTDSLFVRACQAGRLPWGKSLGSMSNDIPHDGKIVKGLFVRAKMYYVNAVLSPKSVAKALAAAVLEEGWRSLDGGERKEEAARLNAEVETVWATVPQNHGKLAAVAVLALERYGQMDAASLIAVEMKANSAKYSLSLHICKGKGLPGRVLKKNMRYYEDMIMGRPIPHQIYENPFKRIGATRNTGQMGCAQFSIQKTTVRFSLSSEPYAARDYHSDEVSYPWGHTLARVLEAPIREHPEFVITAAGLVYEAVTRTLQKCVNKAKYLTFRGILVHRLVAIAFIANDDPMRTLVDHISGQKTDNRIENLRWATPEENNTNQLVRKDSTTGVRGVTRVFGRLTDGVRVPGKFIARITVNGRTEVIGRYDTLDEAARGRFECARETAGEFLSSCERNRSSQVVCCEQLVIAALKNVVDRFDALWEAGEIGAVHSDAEDVRDDCKAIVTQYLAKKVSATSEATNVYYKHAKGSMSGRLFSLGTSLQGLPRRIRQTIALKLYHDVDMVNAHPTILLAWCGAHMAERDYRCLEQYVTTRDVYLTQLSEEMGATEGDIKKLLLKILNGGRPPHSAPKWIRRFQTQARRIASAVDAVEVVLAAETLAKKGEHGYNLEGSTMNRMMCRTENEILMLCTGIFKAAGRHIGALVFDGFMVYKTSNDEAAIRRLLDQCQVAIENRFGFAMKLLVKSMNEAIDLSA